MGFNWKPPIRGAFPLPTPPKVDKADAMVAPDDKRNAETLKSPNDKFSALRAFRRALGLCDRCAEKWKPDHQCATHVQLHGVQEFLDLFSMEPAGSSQISPPEESDDTHSQLCLALSQEAISGNIGPRTMKLIGSIQGHSLIILVDSGSSHTFIAQHIAEQLAGICYSPRAQGGGS